jgi:uncharacterized membrane protein YeiB
MVVLHQTPKKKILLEYGTLVVALVFVSQLNAHDLSLKQLAVSAYNNLANVSSFNAAVEPNEFNSLAQQFDKKEKELTAREEALLAKEAELNARYQESIDYNRKLTLFVLGGVTVLLLVLIFLNFYFDIKREEEREKSLTEHAEGHPAAH